MARVTRRQLLTGLSALWLTALTILAAYALYQINDYSLPISHLYAAFTIALPPLAGVALESLISFQSELAARGALQESKLFQSVNAAFLVYETVLATLAGTYLAPAESGEVMCRLRDTWQAMWMAKDETSIRRIQDAFDCCGFTSPKDMAFPFPHGPSPDNKACMVTYGRDSACLDPWRQAERKVAVILLIVPIGVFIWKLALFLAPGYDTPWLPSALRLPAGRRNHQTLEYRDVEDVGDADDNNSVRAEVDQLNADSGIASRVESGRAHPSALADAHQGNAWSRDE